MLASEVVYCQTVPGLTPRPVHCCTVELLSLIESSLVSRSVGLPPPVSKKRLLFVFFKQVSHASTLVIVFTVMQHMRLVERKRSNFVKDDL